MRVDVVSDEGFCFVVAVVVVVVDGCGSYGGLGGAVDVVVSNAAEGAVKTFNRLRAGVRTDGTDCNGRRTGRRGQAAGRPAFWLLFRCRCLRHRIAIDASPECSFATNQNQPTNCLHQRRRRRRRHNKELRFQQQRHRWRRTRIWTPTLAPSPPARPSCLRSTGTHFYAHLVRRRRRRRRTTRRPMQLRGSEQERSDGWMDGWMEPRGFSRRRLAEKDTD